MNNTAIFIFFNNYYYLFYNENFGLNANDIGLFFDNDGLYKYNDIVYYYVSFHMSKLTDYLKNIKKFNILILNSDTSIKFFHKNDKKTNLFGFKNIFLFSDKKTDNMMHFPFYDLYYNKTLHFVKNDQNNIFKNKECDKINSPNLSKNTSPKDAIIFSNNPSPKDYIFVEHIILPKENCIKSLKSNSSSFDHVEIIDQYENIDYKYFKKSYGELDDFINL